MCDCKRTELKNLNHKTGFAEKFCMDCGKNLGEIPASYNAVMDYCLKRKSNVHYPVPSTTNNMVVLDNLKYDRSY